MRRLHGSAARSILAEIHRQSRGLAIDIRRDLDGQCLGDVIVPLVQNDTNARKTLIGPDGGGWLEERKHSGSG